MRKTLCIIACIVAAFASLFALAACTTEGAPGAYYSVAVDGGTGSGKYDAGAVCQVEAVVPEGMQFMKWVKNGQEVSVNPVYKFEVTENSRLVAGFWGGGGGNDQKGGGVRGGEGVGGGMVWSHSRSTNTPSGGGFRWSTPLLSSEGADVAPRWAVSRLWIRNGSVFSSRWMTRAGKRPGSTSRSCCSCLTTVVWSHLRSAFSAALPRTR